MQKQVKNGTISSATFAQSHLAPASLWHVYGSHQKKRLAKGQNPFLSAREKAEEHKLAENSSPRRDNDEEAEGNYEDEEKEQGN